MPAMVVNATQFKAKCLAILTEIEDSGVTVTITRRGHPVAVLSPAKKKTAIRFSGALAGKLQIPEDLLNEDRSGLWKVTAGE